MNEGMDVYIGDTVFPFQGFQLIRNYCYSYYLNKYFFFNDFQYFLPSYVIGPIDV